MKKNNISLTSEIFFKGFIPNCLFCFIVLFYSIFIANVKLTKDCSIFIANFELTRHYHFVILFLLFALFVEFVLAPFSNLFITARASRLLKKWRNEDGDVEKRTELFKALHLLPKLKQIECFIYYVICSVFIYGFFRYFARVNDGICLAILMACLLGAYVSGLLAVSYSRRICSVYEKAVVKSGIDESILETKTAFGLSYRQNFFAFCIVPVICSMVIFFIVFYTYYYNNVETPSGIGYTNAGIMQFGISKGQLKRLTVILIINVVMSCLSVYSFLYAILSSSEQLQDSMTHIIKNDIFTVELNSTDFDNELAYNLHLVNKVVLLFRTIFDEIKKIRQTMNAPIDSINEISQATAVASLEQSTGVKEILATMEETDSQTREIVDKIADVTEIAENTAKNVQAGFETLQSNLDKMNDITEANVTTIAGIRELGEKIGSIWEIVKIINDIADQTRIIAFNAELEASSAGDLGKNFHIVANEVRRLAAGITNSVEQIKERITEIQHSSDNLIITSESGTEKIREGLELSEKLKEKFSDIQNSSEITVESALQIKEIIYQQSTAFDQIVTTVRQISAGIESFSSSTGTMNETAKKLKTAANNLENLHKTIVQ